MALRINFADSQIVAPLYGYSYACAGGKVSSGQAAVVGYEAPGKEPILSWLSVVVRKDVVTIAVPASEVPLLGEEQKDPKSTNSKLPAGKSSMVYGVVRSWQRAGWSAGTSS